jgi:hypothetical protein
MKLANEGRQTCLVVLTVELLSMPALQIGLEGKGEKILICTSMYADSADYLRLGDTRLILQEKVVFA